MAGPPRKPLKDRLLSRITIVESTGCWEFAGTKLPSGYARISVGGHQGKMILAHRASWLAHKGPIPPNTYVCHHCDNPPCIRPDHLFLGSNAENMMDCADKKRAKGIRNQVLSGEDATEIRRRAAAGYTQHKLARDYDVSPTHIGYIVNRKTWKHVS